MLIRQNIMNIKLVIESNLQSFFSRVWHLSVLVDRLYWGLHFFFQQWVTQELVRVFVWIQCVFIQSLHICKRQTVLPCLLGWGLYFSAVQKEHASGQKCMHIGRGTRGVRGRKEASTLLLIHALKISSFGFWLRHLKIQKHPLNISRAVTSASLTSLPFTLPPPPHTLQIVRSCEMYQCSKSRFSSSLAGSPSPKKIFFTTTLGGKS